MTCQRAELMQAAIEGAAIRVVEATNEWRSSADMMPSNEMMEAIDSLEATLERAGYSCRSADEGSKR